MSKSKVREAPLAPACVFLGMVLCMLVPAACDPRPMSTGATVSDSAGVRIVELDFGFDGPAERRSLASEPGQVIRFPEDDPALAVSGIADVEVLSDGRIAVATEGENNILVFDSAGDHLDTWGGSGDGPGEFVRFDWLARRAPDSLAAGEVRVRRVSMVGAFFEQPEAVEGAVRPPVEIVAIPPAGDTVLSVGTWPGDELSLFRRDGFLEVVAPPFARRLHVATAPDGIWIADDASLEIREYSGQARLRTVVRSSASPHSVSDALLEQRIADKYRSAAQGPALERLKR
ncbi:MAG: hypothetical protein F4205_14060 [Gemmatimonadetes bacterium]|nr:hypothetical protein [Gemmatimonadota bacterium]MYG36609.1 hypothetical protein [Gemmatimonadota bacterium]